MKTAIIQLITGSLLCLSSPILLPGQNFQGGGYQGGTYGSGGMEIITWISEPQDDSPVSFDIFPNPIDRRTNIHITVSAPGKTVISVLDITNRQVRVIFGPTDLPPGDYTLNWDGTDDNGISLSSGLYFCRMVQVNKILWKKVVLVGR